MSDWYYLIGEQQFGPLNEEDLKGQIRSGKLPPNTYVFRNGLDGWIFNQQLSQLDASAPDYSEKAAQIAAERDAFQLDEWEVENAAHFYWPVFIATSCLFVAHAEGRKKKAQL
jgi:hypothetical protein